MGELPKWRFDGATVTLSTDRAVVTRFVLCSARGMALPGSARFPASPTSAKSGGLAWTPPRRLSRLETEAAHVVYLTDSDEEGEKYREDLKGVGVSEDRIFSWPAAGSTGLTIEDFEGDVPDDGAAQAIESWQEERGIEPISKTAIAEHLLRVRRANLAYVYWDPGEATPLPLLRESRLSSVVQLYGELHSALEIEDDEDDD